MLCIKPTPLLEREQLQVVHLHLATQFAYEAKDSLCHRKSIKSKGFEHLYRSRGLPLWLHVWEKGKVHQASCKLLKEAKRIRKKEGSSQAQEQSVQQKKRGHLWGAPTCPFSLQ